MRKILLGFFLAASTATGAQIPRPAPEFAIHMLDGSQTLLSSYRGKAVVLAFVFTTCPHCQNVCGILSGIQRDYAGKGVQILASAFDDGGLNRLPGFAQSYVHGFPVGWDDKLAVLEFLQHSAMEPYFVPILVYIDKKGTIRSQYIGDEEYLRNPDVNIRASIDALLKEPAAKPAVHRKAATTSSLKK